MKPWGPNRTLFKLLALLQVYLRLAKGARAQELKGAVEACILLGTVLDTVTWSYPSAGFFTLMLCWLSCGRLRAS